MRVTEQLRALRRRTGLSRQAFARALGYRSASGYYRFEDPDLFRQPSLPPSLVARLDAIVGTGSPPITAEEVAALAARDEVGSPLETALRDVRDAHARLSAALDAGDLDMASSHCHILLGCIGILRAVQGRA
jgi:hypothetical protein